jgi:hypothetical protein
MQPNSRDSWADAIFWGVTLTILALIVGMPVFLYLKVLGR